MTLVPAYGRDYKNQKALLADWKADKDFQIASIFGGDCGRYANKTDLKGTGNHMIRYGQLRKVLTVSA